MIGDAIDRAVLAHYYVWLAFTAVPYPFGQVRFKSTKRYLTARGFATL